MIGKYIRLIMAVLLTIGSVFLFVFGHTGWGVFGIIIALLLVLFHFKNEMNLVAMLFIRKNKFAQAESILEKVKHPERMIKSQEAFYYYLLGVAQAQTQQLAKAEKHFKKALSTGLRMKTDQAMAKLSLASFYLAKRNKRLAINHLKEAKKLDERKMLTAQIKELEFMLKRI